MWGRMTGRLPYTVPTTLPPPSYALIGRLGAFQNKKCRPTLASIPQSAYQQIRARVKRL